MSADRKIDWSQAGKNSSSDLTKIIQITNFGGIGNGNALNDLPVFDAINSLSGSGGGTLTFPAGIFVFSQTINLPSNITLRGAGSDQTVLRFNQATATMNLVAAIGNTTGTQALFSASGVKNANQFQVNTTAGFAVGDYVRISFDDASLVSSSWALGSVGQIELVTAIQGNVITIASSLRHDYPLASNPKITRIIPVKNVGIECLKIERTAISADPAVQVSNVVFRYVVQSQIAGVESEVSSFSHVLMEECAHISVSGSWFHHGLDYGSGGRAYGVTCQSATNLCLITNNVFNHLRHSMLLQAGANGNVFAYNFSADPYQSDPGVPSDLSGDFVIHGNYPFANLAEGNQLSHLIMDNSHGRNGPGNTFLRNRLNGVGMTISNADQANLIGNEVIGNKTYQGVPVPNWNISGSGHFLAGNVVKVTDGGSNYTVKNVGSTVGDNSFFYFSKPDYQLSAYVWPLFGTNATPNLQVQNEASIRFGASVKTVCPDEDALPVTLKNFNAKVTGCRVTLSWETSEEINADGFSVEYSTDGKTYQSVQMIPAVGKASQYNYTHGELGQSSAWVYYRLRMIDNDRTYKLSRVVSVLPECYAAFVYPIFTSGLVSVNQLVGSEMISLYSTSGKLL